MSFAYPTFNAVRHDPLSIIGFVVANMTMLFIAVGFFLPKFFEPFVPVEKRGEGHIDFSPNVAIAVVDISQGRVVEEAVVRGRGNKSHGDNVGFDEVEVK